MKTSRTISKPSFGDICEMTEGAAVRWRRGEFFEFEEFFLRLFRNPGYWAYCEYMNRAAGREVERLRHKARRPQYYEAENARRRRLAAERRKIRRRRTLNDCPTKEAILDAWERRRESHEAAIRFGSLVEDLECYIDNSLRRNEEGVIVGRNPGVKGWLRENAPELARMYTTVMRYKAAAKKLKQIVDLADPVPADTVVVHTGAQGAEGAVVLAAHGVPDVAVVRARAMWEEIVKDVRANATALFARIDALTDPGRVEDSNMLAAWREKYKNEITERTKKRWWLKRLWRRTG